MAEIRWTYSKLASRALDDAMIDTMMGGKTAYNQTIGMLKKPHDIRDYEYNYDRCFKNDEDNPSKRGHRKGRRARD